MDIFIDDNFIYLETPYHLKALAGEHLGGVWSAKHKKFKYPKNLQCMNELTVQFPELLDSVRFMSVWNRVENGRRALLELKNLSETSSVKNYPTLRPYQRADIAYLMRVKSAGIFNEPRTGKTPTSIALMNQLETSVNLIICPASLIWNWSREFEKWDPNMSVFVIHGSPKERSVQFDKFKSNTSRKVMVISKDTWKSVHEEFSKFTFDAVFVDEAHYLRNYKTSQSKAVFKVKADRRYALTGTPTVKHAIDIWGILHFLYPDKFSSYWNFANRYFDVTEDFFGHTQVGKVMPHRQTELQELIGFMSVQRKRSEVMNWLPEKEYVTFYVEMDKKQAKLYEQMKKEFLITNDEHEVILDTSNVLAQLTRLRQICLDPQLIEQDAPSAKTEALIEYLENNQEPVVIMSQFTSYLNKLESLLSSKNYKVAMITGEMSNAEKQRSAERFQNGEIDILLCNLLSAGTGFTLDRGETIIFMDKGWNPSDNEQAEDRITPTTKDRLHSHTIISFVAQNTFDEALNKLLAEKKSLTDVINQGGRQAIQNLLRTGNYDTIRN